MWIFLGIIGFIALVITVILLLPVRVIIKNDEDNNLIILYKILNKTFGEHPDPNNPVVLALKKSTGIDKLEPSRVKSTVKKSGVKTTLTQTLSILRDLLFEVVALLKYCTAERFELRVLCIGEDAAEAAIHYGECCAAAYPILGAIGSLVKIKKRGKRVAISCDFSGKEEIFRYHFVLKIRLFRATAALLRISLKEARRKVLADRQSR